MSSHRPHPGWQERSIQLLGEKKFVRIQESNVHGGFKVVFSTEQVQKEMVQPVEGEPNKKSTVGTTSYVPAIFGCTLASIVIRDLVNAPLL